MTLESTAVIQGFTNSDAVQPGLQRTALAKTANAFEGLEKNFPRAVSCIAGIGQHAQNQIEDRSMVVGNENAESGVQAGRQPRQELGFRTAPRTRAGPTRERCPIRPT